MDALLIIVLVAAAVTASFVRNIDYVSEVTVWADTVLKSSEKARPHNNYGHALKESHNLEEAVKQFEWAIAIKPDYPDALNNLATIYGSTGRPDDSRAILLKVLQLDPGHIQARANLALNYYEMGRLDDAIQEYNIIISISPYSKEAAFARSMVGMIMKQQAAQ